MKYHSICFVSATIKILCWMMISIIFALVLQLNVTSAAAATLMYLGMSSSTGASAAVTVDLTKLSSTTSSVGVSLQKNDIVIVTEAFATNGTDANPGVGTAGYTEIADLFANDNGTVDANVSVNYKVMGATPDTSVSCNGSGSALNGVACAAYVWRGVDPQNPLDVTSTTVTGTNSTLVDSPSITPITPGAVVITTGGSVDSTIFTQATPPSGYSNKVATTSVDVGNAAQVVFASKYWTSGAENPAAWAILTNGSTGWGAVSIALRPDISRKIRIFSGYRIRLIEGRIQLHQR